MAFLFAGPAGTAQAQEVMMTATMELTDGSGTVSSESGGMSLVAMAGPAQETDGIAEDAPTMKPTRVIYYAMPAGQAEGSSGSEEAPVARLLNVGPSAGTGVVYTMTARASSSGTVTAVASSGQVTVTSMAVAVGPGGPLLSTSSASTASAQSSLSSVAVTQSPVAGALSLLGTLQAPTSLMGSLPAAFPAGPQLAALNTVWTSGNAQLLNGAGAALGTASALQPAMLPGNAPAAGVGLAASPGLASGGIGATGLGSLQVPGLAPQGVALANAAAVPGLVSVPAAARP